MKVNKTFSKKLFGKDISIKYIWIELFIAILLVTAICSIAANSISSRKIENNFDKLNRELYKKIQIQFDTMLNSFSQAALELATDADVADITTMRETSATQKQITGMQSALANKSIVMRNASDYHIYFSRSGMIGSADGLFPAQDYFQTHYSYLNLRDSQWKRWILSETENLYIPVTGVDGHQYLLLKYPLSGTVREIVSSSLIVVLEEKTLRKMMKNIPAFDDSYVQVTAPSGEVLFSLSPNDKLRMQPISYFDNEKVPKQIKIGRKSYRVIVNMSKNMGWQFSYCIPSSFYRKNLFPVSILLYTMLFICIFLELFALWRSYSKSYLPLKSIVSMVNKGDLKGNELNTIRKNIMDMLDAEKKYSSMIDNQNNVIRNNYLYLLLSGVLSEKEMDEAVLKEKNISFPYPCFMTAAFHVSEYGVLEDDFDKLLENTQPFELMAFIIDNIYRDLSEKYNLNYQFVKVGRNFYIILNLKDESQSETVIESFHELSKLMEEHFEIQTAVALSGCYCDLYGVPSTYKEAVEGRDFLELVGESMIVEYKEIVGDGVAQYRLEYDFYNEIFKLIRQQCADDANKLIRRRLTEKLNAAAPYRAISYTIYDIVNHILGQFQEYLMDSTQVAALFQMNLSSREDVEKALLQLDHLVEQICKEIASRENSTDMKEAKHKIIAEQICKIIENGYQSHEMNVTMVANELGFSRAFVSRVFQKEYGESVLDYINRVRYEKARELILTTHFTFEKIARQTGFTNISTFNRVFNKFEGVSPGTFKKQHIK